MSPAGIIALPPAAHAEVERLKDDPRHQSMSLRTTQDVDPKIQRPGVQPPIIARIVKLRLADLDIYCPSDPFDIRLSVNIEIDFQGRQDIDPSLLVISPEEEARSKNPKPPRYKDRLSFKHLAYSIDLTQVSYSAIKDGGPKTHELEVEVDAMLLRQQAELLRRGEENAFEAVVEGLLNNVFLLTRVRGP